MLKYSFSLEGDDHELTRILYESIKGSDKSSSELAKFGLRKSKDESFRSVCVEYLVSLDLLNEQDLLVALNDEDETVRMDAITASEDIDSIEIRKKLVSLAQVESDDFVVAWIIATLGLKDHDLSSSLSEIKSRWASSEIVQCAISFYGAFTQGDKSEIISFFQFLKSGDHLVRGMVANLSDCFVESGLSKKIESLLTDQFSKEDWVSIKEVLESKIDAFKNGDPLS